MVPLRFVKIPPQGTERKCIRQEKKYETSEVRKVIIKAYTIFSIPWLKTLEIYAILKNLFLPQENKILYLKNLPLNDPK